MSSSRMGFNLWNKGGRKNLGTVLSSRAYKLDISMVLSDTFMPILCFFMGHKPYDAGAGWSSPEWACRRCGNYLSTTK